MKIKTSIIGASGYTGSELLRLLSQHPHFEVGATTAHSLVGKKISEVYPNLGIYGNKAFTSFDESKDSISGSELVFSALPHGASMSVLPDLENKLIIDLGSDFRLQDSSLYPKWYGRDHIIPEVLKDWTYGMAELFPEQIKKATRIANPGCYPTASSLPLAPLLKEGLLEDGPIQIDAISGVSGAGRIPGEKVHFSHVDENLSAYKVCTHQHTPEIEMALSKFSAKNVAVSFTAHLAPMVRGIHATSSAQVSSGVDEKKLKDALLAFYRNKDFVFVVDDQPQTKAVMGSNAIQMSLKLDTRLGRVIVTSSIDNLVKGAAGQAIQNANLALGLSEFLGLSGVGLYP